MSAAVRAEVVVIGAGVTGLWIRALLARAGRATVALESAGLGSGQTIASQGILHGGVKYALTPRARAAASALCAAIPAWDDALAGRGPVPLRGVPVLSERTCLWSGPGVLGGLTGRVAHALLRSRVRELPVDQRPPWLAGAPAGVRAWEVAERVIDPAGLLRSLAACASDPILLVDRTGTAIRPSGDGAVVHCRAHDGRSASIECRSVVLAAGVGNEALLDAIQGGPGSAPCAAQRRPLHMAIVRPVPHAIFGHCIRPLSDRPLLTITRATLPDGPGWYVGGDPAERGVGRSPDEQAHAVRRALSACLPWLDMRNVAVATHRVDRAEWRTRTGRRPAGPGICRVGPVVAVWPTKLALAPVAAQRVCEHLRSTDRGPSGAGRHELAGWPAPDVAEAPWACKDLAWN